MCSGRDPGVARLPSTSPACPVETFGYSGVTFRRSYTLSEDGYKGPCTQKPLPLFSPLDLTQLAPRRTSLAVPLIVLFCFLLFSLPFFLLP